jgi:hypothetical protein
MIIKLFIKSWKEESLMVEKKEISWKEFVRISRKGDPLRGYSVHSTDSDKVEFFSDIDCCTIPGRVNIIVNKNKFTLKDSEFQSAKIEVKSQTKFLEANIDNSNFENLDLHCLHCSIISSSARSIHIKSDHIIFDESAEDKNTFGEIILETSSLIQLNALSALNLKIINATTSRIKLSYVYRNKLLLSDCQINVLEMEAVKVYGADSGLVFHKVGFQGVIDTVNCDFSEAKFGTSDTSMDFIGTGNRWPTQISEEYHEGIGKPLLIYKIECLNKLSSLTEKSDPTTYQLIQTKIKKK